MRMVDRWRSACSGGASKNTAVAGRIDLFEKRRFPAQNPLQTTEAPTLTLADAHTTRSTLSARTLPFLEQPRAKQLNWPFSSERHNEEPRMSRGRRLAAAHSVLALILFAGVHVIGAQDSSSPSKTGDNGVTLPSPPVATINIVTDDYSGTKIEDPYRWLEDAKSPATRAWIGEENAYTQKYLDQITTLPQIASQLTSLMRVDQYSTPTLRAGKYFFRKRLADENQGSIYMRAGWHGDDRRLIDATKLSADQNTSANMVDVSDDGNLLVYEIREGGADEGSVHILNVRTGADLPDVLPSARYSGVSLSPD